MQYFENTAIEKFDKYNVVVDALKFFNAFEQAKILIEAIAIRKSEKKERIQDVQEYVNQVKEGKYEYLDNKYYNCNPDVIQLIEDLMGKYVKEVLVKSDLLAEYIEQAKYTNLEPSDYSDSKKVLRNNRAAIQMRKITICIDKESSEIKNEFMMLLNNPELKCIVAHHMLEVMDCDLVAQKKLLLL